MKLHEADPGDVIAIENEYFVVPHEPSQPPEGICRVICLTHFAPLIMGFGRQTECRYVGRANLDARVPSVLSHVIQEPANDGRPK